MKKAFILTGGWDGHEPNLVSERFKRILEQHDYQVTVTDDTAPLADAEYLKSMDLIIPCRTMSKLEWAHEQNISRAVAAGTGLAGCHGGMCDAFRESVEWQFMTGGQWVSHPGGDGIRYTVNICRGANPITEGLDDFDVVSEHYYLHVDPAVEVLATTRFPVVNWYHAANKPVDMPVAWTKFWGLGRVFYCSLGHHDDVFDKSPNAEILMSRGMLWAGEGRAYARERGLTPDIYENTAKMF